MMDERKPNTFYGAFDGPVIEQLVQQAPKLKVPKKGNPNHVNPVNYQVSMALRPCVDSGASAMTDALYLGEQTPNKDQYR